MGPDPRITSPSTQRNRDPILDVLRRHLPEQGALLEVASGTGEHMAHFAQHLPGWTFQPSDIDADRRASVDAWGQGRTAIRPAIHLDTTGDWPTGPFDAVLCCNMIHIAPWSAAIGLLAGSARVLRRGGMLILYGPFRRNGAHTAASNADFDADLQRRDSAWGIRDLETVAAQAAARGFSQPDITLMPANNLCLVFTLAD